MKNFIYLLVSFSLSLLVLPAQAGQPQPAMPESPPLIVVQDAGGTSALPYYEAINLQRGTADQTKDEASASPAALKSRFSEADLLPVRSAHLSPGTVTTRTLHAPGLTPIFLIGDDEKSHAWLRKNLERLRSLRAVGLVVQVDSQKNLDALRRLAPGLTLAPSSGDDLAQRLNIQHYPVLITATAIEQ